MIYRNLRFDPNTEKLISYYFISKKLEHRMNTLTTSVKSLFKLRNGFNVNNDKLVALKNDQMKLTRIYQIFDYANSDLEFISQFYIQEIRNIIIEINEMNLINDINIRPNKIAFRFTLNDREMIIDGTKDDINVNKLKLESFQFPVV